MAQFLIVRDRLLRELGAVDYKRPHPRHHRRGARLAAPDRERRGLPRRCRCPPDVDGRFSVLTAGRPLPGGGRGRRHRGAARRRGRAWTSACARAESPLADPALALAGVALARSPRARGKRIVVLMSYSERLAAIGDWFCQLWGESLGKAVDRDGPPRRVGPDAGPRARQRRPALAAPALPRGAARQGRRSSCASRTTATPLDIPAAYQDLESVGYLGGQLARRRS